MSGGQVCGDQGLEMARDGDLAGIDIYFAGGREARDVGALADVAADDTVGVLVCGLCQGERGYWPGGRRAGVGA